MTAPAGSPVHGGKIRTPVGDAPIVPLGMVIAGAYLTWFGIRYWRDQQTTLPSDPVKSVLQGKGLPASSRSPSVAAAAGTAATAAGPPPGSGIPVGSVTGEAIARDEQQYVGKIRYLWAGSSPATGWDCSGMQNYCLCHDLGIDIPGYKGGTFTGKVHGPDVAMWLGWHGVKRVTGKPRPGDLLAWGPNEHIGCAISATQMISAENPSAGTQVSDIHGFFNTPPIILRLRAIDTQGGGGDTRRQGQLLAGRYGWSPSQDAAQWGALDKLWTAESGWSVTAENPTSGAYGIPQALPGSKMAQFGKAWRTSAQVQIRWGLWYIKQRYGTPEAAWAHEQQHGWY